MGSKALVVQKRPGGTASILDEEMVAVPVDLGMLTRYTLLQPPIWTQIQVRKNTVGGIGAPQPDFTDWQWE